MELRILAVDDEQAMLSLYSGLFRPGRYRLTLARSVEEGLNLLESGTYDPLISDPLLPDGTGLELTRRFRELGAGRSILISGALPADVLSRIEKKEGLLRAFASPFDIAGLTKVVEGFAGAQAAGNLTGKSASLHRELRLVVYTMLRG